MFGAGHDGAADPRSHAAGWSGTVWAEDSVIIGGADDFEIFPMVAEPPAGVFADLDELTLWVCFKPFLSHFAHDLIAPFIVGQVDHVISCVHGGGNENGKMQPADARGR